MDGRARLDLVSRWISTRLSTILSGRWQQPFARCGTGFTPRRSLIDRPAAYADKDHPEQIGRINELLDLDHSDDGVREVLGMAKDLAQRYFLLQNPEA